MIQELVALSSRLRKGQEAEKTTHDALTQVPVGIDCVIDQKGSFKQFQIVPDKKPTLAERVPAKKGNSRLLLDRAEEVLGIVLDSRKTEETKKKHKRFLEKLATYKHLKELEPAILFYEKNKTNGIEKARAKFFDQIGEKERIGNIAFRVFGASHRLHEQNPIYDAIIKQYGTFLIEIKNSRLERCSICGPTSHPVADKPHGMIKGVPGQPRRDRAFVSYNKNSFESYGLIGNENSSVCTHCAKAYVDGLNWLLAPSSWMPSEKKGKPRPIFKNRRDISNDRSNDTVVVFWLQKKSELSDLDLLDQPDEKAIHALFDSVFSGEPRRAQKLESDKFYAITLSGVAARIAVRDWIETSVENLRANLAQWFKDIEVVRYNPDQAKLMNHYPRFKSLVWNVKSNNDNDVQHRRIGAVLWKCAVMGYSPPLWILSAVLNRIRTEQGKTTPERIALLKLYLYRKLNQQERNKLMSDYNIAYVCGQLFAVLELIQLASNDFKEVNAGIRQRFFSFASTMPSTAFGRLLKLTQHHLSKIRGEKRGLAVSLDKRLQALMCQVEGSRFPVVFSLEDQASFAIGYYHERQKPLTTKQSNKEE